MFKQIATASLVTCFAATGANAGTPEMYNYLSHSSLVSAVQSTGTIVTYNSIECNRNILGFYTLRSDGRGNITRDELGLCIENHKGDLENLSDTLRHEAIHVAQACKGGPITDDIEEVKAIATPAIHQILTQYSEAHQHVEYEAFVGAHYLSDAEVVATVQKFCFE